MFFFTLPFTPWKLFILPWSTSISMLVSTTAKGSKEAQHLKKQSCSFQHCFWCQLCHKTQRHHPWVGRLALVLGWEHYHRVLRSFSSAPKLPHHTVWPCHTWMVSPYLTWPIKCGIASHRQSPLSLELITITQLSKKKQTVQEQSPSDRGAYSDC